MRFARRQTMTIAAWVQRPRAGTAGMTHRWSENSRSSTVSESRTCGRSGNSGQGLCRDAPSGTPHDLTISNEHRWPSCAVIMFTAKRGRRTISSSGRQSMTSILRWAGSKRKLVKELRTLAPHTFKSYVEPFAGSAVLFFDLLPVRAVLGDLNPEVIATYAAIRDTPDEVSRYLKSIPKSSEAYYEVRALNPTLLSRPQRAARLIYLMKACFNGVYRTNRQGKFNVPLGSKFFALPDDEMILRASEALAQVDLVCGDFSQATAKAEPGDFVYLDPPYSDSTRFRGEYSYQGAFRSSDMDRLVARCNELTARGVQVLLSFKESDALVHALGGWSFKRLDVDRSVSGFAHSRRTAREILAHNY